IDEKTGIQALDRTQPSLPMLAGSPATATHDYIRNGTIDLFAALNVGTGTVITRTDRRHRAIEFRRFLDLVAAQVPPDPAVHAVLDHAPPHTPPPTARCLQRHPRFELPFPPTSSSCSTWSSGGSPNSPTRNCAAPPTAASKTSPTTSSPGLKPGTTTPAPSCGARPPTRSSKTSQDTASEL